MLIPLDQLVRHPDKPDGSDGVVLLFDPVRVEHYRAMLRQGLVAPPITVEVVRDEHGIHYVCFDGHHRAEAARAEGR